MNSYWNNNGFLIIDNFYTENECDKLKIRANDLVKNFDETSHKTIFNSKNPKHTDDEYFLNSSDKIRFFFEKR